ncbi:F0F1 ATP synthase subunit A [Fodinicola feengrottensis]|uniref:ATP synthase subunit a n=1 Tax=Fodinicola feengrottensis TaxID=435914 RepID=A0ABN2FUR6_9ACTN|nr:F0F1 ATP synthase subunit A [Fodinicola feengrottensis]
MITTPLAAAGDGIQVGHHIQATIGGWTFNLDTIWTTVLAGAIVVAMGLLIARKATGGVPSKPQILWETVIGQIEDQVEENVGLKVAPFVVPLAVSIFFFILICNWLELLPTQWNENFHLLPAPTADVNLTYALGLFTIILMHVMTIRRKGFGRWIKDTVKGHAAFLAPINIIEELVKPFTLALRLFGNIFAGGIMLSIIALIPWWGTWLPNIAWKLFDMFIGVLQAVIFALLTILYFGFQMAEEEH